MKLLLLTATLAVTLILAAPISAQEVKSEIENEWVRVVRETLTPHAKAPMREHPPQVVIYLSSAQERIIPDNGKATTIRRKYGDVAYFDGGTYARENVSNVMINEVIIELTNPSKPSRTTPITLDPVKLDPKHHRIRLENDRVRVIDTILVPHLKSPEHEHPRYVVVYLTELHTTQTLPDGRVVDNPRSAGEIAWREATKHVTENVGARTAEEIQVELK
jgi:hypothetical protein